MVTLCLALGQEGRPPAYKPLLSDGTASIWNGRVSTHILWALVSPACKARIEVPLKENSRLGSFSYICL